jgi:hypothetical protein
MFKERENEEKIDKFVGVVLTSAQAKCDFYEKLSRFFGTVSIWLYIAGWALSLAGRVFSAEELVPGMD